MESLIEQHRQGELTDDELISKLNLKPTQKTIGQLVGMIGHTFSITNNNNDKVQVAVKVDFRTATDLDIRTWIVSNRVIAGQRPWRSLSKAELLELDGTTFIAQNIGQKVRSRVEQVAELKATFMKAGIAEVKAEGLAITAIDNPDLLTVRNDIVENPDLLTVRDDKDAKE